MASVASGAPSAADPAFERWIRKKELLERGLEVSIYLSPFQQCMALLLPSAEY